MTHEFLRFAGLKKGLLAARALALAAGVSHAQVVDHQVPLNYNFHGMAHQGEAITGAMSSNADFILYRGISDRGLYWDTSDPNAFGTNPIIGFTGINYGLFDTLGYANETAISQGDAQTFALDMVHLGGRGVWFRLYDSDGSTTNGPFPPWEPDATHNADHTGDQVTVLGSPFTVDAQTEIGVLYMVSDSGGQFDCVLTFNNGSTDTNVTVPSRPPTGSEPLPTPPSTAASPSLLRRRSRTPSPARPTRRSAACKITIRPRSRPSQRPTRPAISTSPRASSACP